MTAEYTAGPNDRWDEEGIGRETNTNGPQEIDDGPEAQDLRAAAAENGQEPVVSKDEVEICDDNGQAVDQASHKESAGKDFYKSQEEVDRAFGYRLASERRRWEREHKEELQKARSKPQDLAETDTWLPHKQMYAGEYAFFADMVAQAEALAAQSLEFNLMEELNNNAAFEKMVANGVPVAEAYETVGQAPLLNKEQSIRQDERQRIMEEMESRSRNLPAVDRDPGLSGPVLDVTRISEEELTRLAERVRKGERVVI